MIIEKFKDVATEDISLLLDFAKVVYVSKKRSNVFYIGLCFFVLPSTILLIWQRFSFNSISIFTIAFFTYFAFWKFFLEKKYFDKELEKELEAQIEEFEIILKHRN